MSARKQLPLWLLGVATLATVLTFVDGRTPSWVGWLSYLVVATLCAAAAWLGWRALRGHQAPRVFAVAAMVAFGLRLGLAVAFAHLLPVYGSGRDHQQAGYFYPDAYDRDRISWEFGRSDRPLWEPSQREMRADQYGGLLMLSAVEYRYLSPDAHRPLLVVLQAATASSLAVLFTWGFVSLAIGSSAAAFAAWLVALYPEAILLGASQMREPFMALGLSLMLYGYALARKDGLPRGAVPLVVGVALCLAISPPTALVGLVILLIAWLWERRGSRRPPVWVWPVVGVGLVVALLLATRAWEASGVWGTNTLDILLAWLTRSARYETYVLEQGSGMVQAMFDRTPTWAHVPLATAYGLIRPFLPAALFETSAPLARIVEIARSVGWFALLPFLIYALLATPRSTGWRSLPTFLAILVWVTAIAASFRGGADGWDNVRYRAAFLVIQAAVAGGAWAHVRSTGSRWLAYTGVVVAAVTVVFGQWYAGRYLGTPALSLELTLISAVAIAVILLVLFAAYDRRRRGRLTQPPPDV
jgi:hypothetical protein